MVVCLEDCHLVVPGVCVCVCVCYNRYGKYFERDLASVLFTTLISLLITALFHFVCTS